MIIREHLAQPSADVDGVRIFCSTGNTESSARPDAEVPGLTIERLGGLGVGNTEAAIETQKQNPPRRHGDTENSDRQKVVKFNLKSPWEYEKTIRWSGKRPIGTFPYHEHFY